MANILITDAPIAKALEEQDSKDFETLWDLLKVGTIHGYITPNDLQQLEQSLYNSVGEAFAQKLLAGFRSVLGIYGEPDHPSIDLIIDSESVDELADEIPIRSVSDFLCIYELERLLATSPGEEILASSLFSSISDILEVLDGEDAFVSKALMDAIVPVDDAPTLVSSSHLPSAGTIAIPSNATTEEDTALENRPLTDSIVNSEERSDTLLLSPVIQAILNSGNPSDSPKLDLRFGPERADSKELLTHRLMDPTHTSQSMYDFNVDMFLILGLIMQMAGTDENGLEQNSTVHGALLTGKTTLTQANNSKAEGERTSPEISAPLNTSTDSDGLLKPTELTVDDFVSSQVMSTHPPFHHQKGDRQFDLELLSDGHYKTTGKKILGSREKDRTPSPNSVDSNGASEQTGKLHDPTSQLVDASTQTSHSPDPLDVSFNGQQSSGSKHSIAPRFTGDASSSITDMDPMLSGDQESITEPMVSNQGTSNIRLLSNSAVPEASAHRLRNTLKTISERKQAVKDRLPNSIGQSTGQSEEQALLSPVNTSLTSKTSMPQINRVAQNPPLDIDTSQGREQNHNSDRPNELDSDAISEQEEGTPLEVSASVASPSIVLTSNSDIPQDYVLATPQDSVFLGSVGEDAFIDMWGDNIIKSYSGRDIIQAYDGSNLIYAGPNADLIDTYGGANTIDGGRGGDDIYAVDGTNTIDGGQGGDDIYVVEGTGTITGGQGEDFIKVIDSITTINGGRGGDTIVARTSTATIEGGKGNDFIDLYSVTDTVVNGGSGRDEIDINGRNNTVHGGSGADWIRVLGGSNTINSGKQADGIYVRRGKNLIEAGQGNDAIYIDGGKNSIEAGQGNDVIVVYAGTNTLAGGDGQDLFILHQNADADVVPITDVETDPNHVVITDFTQEQDVIELIDTAADELRLEQVGLNTHIFAGDDLLAVIESVDRDNLLVTGAWIEDPSLADPTLSLFILWESSEIIQEFEQAGNLGLSGEETTVSGDGILPETRETPWVDDIWVVGVGSDI